MTIGGNDLLQGLASDINKLDDFCYNLKNFCEFENKKCFCWGLGIGDWGLGIGDWGLGPIPNFIPIPNPQSNPQSPLLSK